MGEWDLIGQLFDSLQAHSPMLGRFWLFLMLVFRIVILGTVATDLFDDEQEEFACNTLQPGCKQVCYDMAFPISMYRFWVFHIIIISTPALLYLLRSPTRPATTPPPPATPAGGKWEEREERKEREEREERRLRRLYLVNVAFRLVAEVAVLLGQWRLYGFKVDAQYPCSRFPCPYTVDCFVSRPAEKTIFLCFYFAVGVVSGVSSLVELFYAAFKWFCQRTETRPADEWSMRSGGGKTHSPMLGRFWLFLMLVFRILILGTVATDLFEDEQEEFACNTLQPGCKQVCYDMAFPISMYRFWVFHIVLISTPALLYLLYVMHHLSKKKPDATRDDTASSGHAGGGKVGREERRLRRLYLVNVAFRLVAEVAVLLGQLWLYGFKVQAHFPCSRFPCPHTVDCFVSRPAEKTIFLCFYFAVGVVSGVSSLVELFYAAIKWFCPRPRRRCSYLSQNLSNWRREEEEGSMKPGGGGKVPPYGAPSSMKLKRGPVRSSGVRKTSGVGHKSSRHPSTRIYVM
ncbi:Gap junction delta-3 protein [Merluccius polli]|uniref:Gap junction protein n=1 Tax=Merluccius polli TaxID=89951 RepID=A0AA47MDH1_MERPO|nr:Gap junction delta-3 protein [Merluccius polli]